MRELKTLFLQGEDLRKQSILTAFRTVLFLTRCVSSAWGCLVLFIRAWLDHSAVAFGQVLATRVCPALGHFTSTLPTFRTCATVSPRFGHFTISIDMQAWPKNGVSCFTCTLCFFDNLILFGALAILLFLVPVWLLYLYLARILQL